MAIFGVRPPELIINPQSDQLDFTANTTEDTLSPTLGQKHYLRNGDVMKVATSGTLPSPLVADTWYWVIAAESDPATLKLSATRGGGVITLTTTGTGTHTWTTRRSIWLDAVRRISEKEIPDTTHFKFPILGEEIYLHRGAYCELEFVLSLYKYPSPRAKFEELYHIYRQNRLVEIKLHRDGATIKRDEANPATLATWKLINFQKFYFETDKFRDGLRLKFKSTTWVNWSDESDYLAAQDFNLASMPNTA